MMNQKDKDEYIEMLEVMTVDPDGQTVRTFEADSVVRMFDSLVERIENLEILVDELLKL
jgi:tetrahydromethanopterin S-methyltransferase subunit B